MINSNKLKGRMKEKGITQAALAKHLKISQPTCCQKLNNTRQLTLDEANGICEILDISPEHFGSYFFYTIGCKTQHKTRTGGLICSDTTDC